LFCFACIFTLQSQNTLDNVGLTSATPASGAFSLRKLSSAYAGNAILVRRSSDNTNQAIGFLASGHLDTTALKNFVGAGNSGFVNTWYDQSGNSNHAVQGTFANQPRIVNAGVIERVNGQPSLFTDGVDDLLTAPNSPTNNFSIFILERTSVSHQIDAESNSSTAGTSGQNYILGAIQSGVDAGQGLSVGTNGISNYEHGNSYMPPTAVYSGAVNGLNIIDVIYAAKTPSIYLNTALVRSGLTSPRTTVFAARQIGLGSYGAFNGNIPECIIFPTTLSAANRQIVECNQANCFNVAPSSASNLEFYVQGSAAGSACFTDNEIVVWKNSDLVNTTASGNSLSKFQSNGNWDGGAASWNTVFNHGSLVFTASETNTARMIGLSTSNVNSSFSSIQFAVYLRGDAQWEIYESGASRGNFGSYSINDVFKISVEANIVRYYQNNVLRYISGLTPTLPLLVDVSINSVGGTVTNAIVSNYNTGSFTATALNAGASPSYQWKLNGSNVGTNSSSYSNASLANNDVLTCVLSYSTACGTSTISSNSVTNKSVSAPTSIEWYISGTAAASACKEGIEDVKWVFASSALINNVNGNTLTKITRDNNWDGNGFSYQSIGNNGYMQMTAAETNKDRMIGLSASDANGSYTSIQYAFFLQSNGIISIYESAASRGTFGAYATNDVFKISVENNIVKYYKNGVAIYISGLTPSLPLYVDVSTYNVGATANNVKISNGNTGTFSAFGTNLGTSPFYQWLLNGTNVGSNSSVYTNTNLSNSDVVTCAVTLGFGGCSATSYTSNSIVIGNINQTLQNEFYVSGASAASACKEAISDVVWMIASSSLKNTINANSLSKLTSDGSWDGNGFSFQSVGNNGYMQMTAAETNKDRMVGLSATDGNASYLSIQFAFFLQSNGIIGIYESGSSRGTFGAYATNDIFKIAVENNIVKYYKNGVAIYISGITPSLPLYVDVSTYSTGGTVNNVKISNGSISTFTAIGTNLGTSPSYQWKLNGGNVGTNSSTYINTVLSNSDVINCVVTPSISGCSASTYTSNNITIGDINQTLLNEFYITGAAAASACKEAVSDVVWVITASSLKNIISGNTLTKLTSNGSWDGNGFSFQSVGNNGYMQMTVAETTTERMIGLSSSDVDASYTSIQFAFYLAPGGNLYIYESGASRGSYGTYASSDVFKIAVESNVVKYYKNGVAIYISTVAPSLPLFVDVSTKNVGATANNVKISNGNISTFTAIGTNLGTSPTYQWKLNGNNVGTNSSTYVNTLLSNADAIRCVVTPSISGCSASTYTSNNITIGDINQTLLNEFYITGAGASSACKEAVSDVVWVIASSSLRNTINSNTLTKLTSDGNWDGNGFSFQSVGNNGYMQMTAAETTTERMIGLSSSDLDASYTSIRFAFYLAPGGNLYIYESGAFRGSFGTYATSDVLKIAVESNVVKYYKNGVAIYISTVAPSLPLFVDVSTKNVGATASNVKISNGNISTFTAIGTNLGTSPSYQWKLNGGNVGTNSSTYINTVLSNSDVINCIVTPSISGCSASTYSSNNITIGDINQTLLNEFYITGAAVPSACKEAISDVVWVIASSSLKNTISNNTLTKLTSEGNWDGNGFSFQSVSNNGYMQMSAAETTTERMIGLSSSDANASYTSIQFAFYLAPGGNLYIYESGAFRGSFGTYASSDVFKIAVESNVVKYYENGVLLYISTVSPSLPLFVDVSTKNVGATANNVKISNGNISTFNAVGTNLGISPIYQWKLNGVNVGSNSPSYSNTGLINNDAVACIVTPNLGGCSTSTFASNNVRIAEPTIGTTTWLGTTNAWNTSANWSNGVPTKYTSAIITSGSNNPVISSNAIVNDITIGSGRSLTINNSSYNLEVYGNFTNQGTFTPNNSTIYMYGCSSSNTLSSTNSISFFNLVTDNTYGLVIGGTSTVTVNNALSLANGAITTGANTLILANSNAANLTYTNGFVFGNFRRNIASNASTYFFAVGSGTNSADRHLSAIVNNFLTGVTSINASVREFTQLAPNNDANLTAIQNTLALVSSVGKTTGQTTIWDFTPNSEPTGGSYGVNLYTENTNLSGFDDNTFFPLKRSSSASYANFSSFEGTSTIPAFGSPGRIYGSGNGFAQRLGYTSFSEYIIGKSSGGILPIELFSFEAKPDGNNVNLNWRTASEKNNAYFTVEKSKDALNFETVGTISGAGNSNSSRAYSLVDFQPFSGVSHYRLKQTDFDGTFNYSKIVAIDFLNEEYGIKIYPNPTSDIITIDFLEHVLPPSTRVSLTNVYGQQLELNQIISKNQINMDLSPLPSGIYFVGISLGEKTIERKIVLQK
jgi:hypothetical protein